MKKVKIYFYLFFCFFLFWGINSLSYAGSAEILPKGIFRTGVKYNYYFSIDKRYNPDGDEEDLAVDYNTTLDDRIFSTLPSGASLGESFVSFEYDFADVILTFNYGLTDKLTVGVIVPFYWNRNKINAKLDSSPSSSANTGKNSDFNPVNFDPNNLLTYPLIPIALGGQRMSTEDVKNILGNGLDVNGDATIDIEGFGYKKFETWSGFGISDIEVGARYQYLKTENWQLAFTGGARLPTGEVDDPDNLVDIGFGNGAYALLFRFNNDYIGIKNLVLNTSLKYDLVLPDREVKRVPDNVNNPITIKKEKVDRDLGDKFELETSGVYKFIKGFEFSLTYRYTSKLKDRISGEMGFAYESLEDETDTTSHVLIAGLFYSTIPMFKVKKFPLPLDISIEYEDWFAGSNNTLKQQFISFSITSFF